MSLSTWRRWLDPVEGTRPRQYRLRDGTYLPDTEFPEVPIGLGLPKPPRLRYPTVEPELTWNATEAARRQRKM